jgi:hypothetical protein
MAATAAYNHRGQPGSQQLGVLAGYLRYPPQSNAVCRISLPPRRHALVKTGKFLLFSQLISRRTAKHSGQRLTLIGLLVQPICNIMQENDSSVLK